MRKCRLAFFFLYISSGCWHVHAQADWNLKENGNWAIPEYSGINFTSGPQPFGIRTQLAPLLDVNSQSSAAVSDKDGNLLFYTNSDSIWDKNGRAMPNGDIGLGIVNYVPNPEGALGGNMMQGVLILPVIDHPQRYYVFSLNGLMDICNLWTPLSHELMYSIVDMTLNNGLGDVDPGFKNIRIDSALGGMMTAVRGDDCNIWLLVHDRDNPVYKAYEITEAGINLNPVLSTTGNFIEDWANKWGMMQVSSDRTKLAFSTTQNASAPGFPTDMPGVELCDFDVKTGIVSNAMAVTDSQVLYDLWTVPWGVCFSPDDTKLYITLGDGVYQFNLNPFNLSDIRSSFTLVTDSIFGENGGTASLLLGQDGKIYTASTGKDTISMNPFIVAPYLGVIHDPNELGAACNFERLGIKLADIEDSLWRGPYWGIGNCNAFAKPLPSDSIFTRTDTFICSNQDNIFLGGYFTEAWIYEWEDSSSDRTRMVYGPGTYWVRSYDFCRYQVDTFVVRSVDVDVDLGSDTATCELTYLIEVPARPGMSFLWQDGSTDSSFLVKSTGTYWVQLTSGEGCVNSDSIRVKVINVRQELGGDLVFCEGDLIDVSLKANIPPGAVAKWNDNSSLSSLQVTDTGKYWVTVIDPPCQESDSIYISKEWCDCHVMVPSAFSPNGDGLNDIFLPIPENPECLELGNYSLEIFNRYGQRIFHGMANGKGWDGTINGRPAEDGVYMYIIKYGFGTKAQQHIKKGDITLLR